MFLKLKNFLKMLWNKIKLKKLQTKNYYSFEFVDDQITILSCISKNMQIILALLINYL